jgi:hypothetical protein
MDHFNDDEIGKLLRLKRHEQPPAGYFENFLHEFHRRQRAELLREPLWRIALQRAHDFMFQLNVPTLASYPAAAAAIVVCAALLSIKVYQTPSANVAKVATQPPVELVAEQDPAWSLSTPVATRDLGATPFRKAPGTARTHGSAATPRYVLDSTPVSYEVALRF